MTSYHPIRQRLPLLYRPEADEDSLLASFLRSVAALLDEVKRETAMVMQSHWFPYADDPRFDPFFSLQYQRAELEKPGADSLELHNFNMVHDLARICALLDLTPWRESVEQREAVFHYRKRVLEIVEIYKAGLGTLPALRAMIAAQLPDDTPDGLLREFGFSIREYRGAPTVTESAKARAAPNDMFGPLMRWSMNNSALYPVSPELLIEGIAADDQHDATIDPVIELFSDSQRRRLAIAYSGTVEPGQTLRLAPVYESWLAGANGLNRAQTSANVALPDPSAAGPWQPMDTGVPGVVSLLLQTHDHWLWAVVNDTELLSFQGDSWQTSLSGLPHIHCLAQRDEQLLLGTEQGLVSIPLYPSDGILTPQPAVETLAGPAIYHLYQNQNDVWWAATSKGVKTLDVNNQLVDTALGASPENQISIFHIDESVTGTLNLASERGLIQYQPGYDQWYWFEGGKFSDTESDWSTFTGGEPPAEDAVFLPQVNVCHRSADGALWLGTEHGLARYIAREVASGAFFTHLQFFPQLNCGAVTDIQSDEVGCQWFCTASGVLRFDGRQWDQVIGDSLQRVLGADDIIGLERVWRFVRASNQWQWFDSDASEWRVATETGVLTTELGAATLLWTMGTVAQLGTWDGSEFVLDEGAVPGDLNMRYKPAADNELRIVEGGIPAVPAMATGLSHWRYLRLETANAEDASLNRPHWTTEGRLLPPPPSDLSPSEEGRFSDPIQALSQFDQSAFAYKPCAKVWFRWQGTHAFNIVVNINAGADWVDPSIVDRVWRGIQQVRPAGVRVQLTVNNEIQRGNSNG